MPKSKLTSSPVVIEIQEEEASASPRVGAGRKWQQSSGRN